MVIIIGQNSIGKLKEWTKVFIDVKHHGTAFYESASNKKGRVTKKDYNYALMNYIKMMYNTYQDTRKIKFVALGNYASAFLKKANIDHYKLPHPGSSNRQLDNKQFVKAELNKCKRFLNGL